MIRYIVIFSLLLASEIAIAVYHFHDFVRGFIGDVLVIPLMYCFFRIITNAPAKTVLLSVLGLAVGIEFLQLFSIAEILKIENTIIQTMLGSTFDLLDLVAYLFGIIPVICIEKCYNDGED